MTFPHLAHVALDCPDARELADFYLGNQAWIEFDSVDVAGHPFYLIPNP